MNAEDLVSRRNSPRIKFRNLISFRDNIPNIMGYTKNLSQNGVCIRVNGTFNEGSEINGEIFSSNTEVEFKGIVRWVREIKEKALYDIGMEIVDFPNELLDQYKKNYNPLTKINS